MLDAAPDEERRTGTNRDKLAYVMSTLKTETPR
jgi:hypothetical protein